MTTHQATIKFDALVSSLGTSLKIKNVNDLSAIVIGTSSRKSSIEIGIYDQQENITPVGNLTIPANAEIPEAEQIIDVQYLWVLGSDGKLIQPIYKRDRTHEIMPGVCTSAQIVYKGDASRVAASHPLHPSGYFQPPIGIHDGLCHMVRVQRCFALRSNNRSTDTPKRPI